jgi:TolB protein
MARTSLDTNSAAISTGIHGDGLTSLQYRLTQGAQTEEVRAPITHVNVIQLERKGNTYSMSVARFGESFTTVQVDDLALGDEIYVGLFVCSHEDNVLETATFQNVRVVVPVKDGFDRGRNPFGSRLEILDVASGHREVIYERNDVFEAPNWTLDGKALIFNSEGRLYRFDLASKTPTLIDMGDVVRNNNDHVISFDGQMLAISSHTGEQHHSMVYTVPLMGGQPMQITPIGPSYLHGWSPDGKYLVFTGLRNGDYDIYRVPATGGDEVQLTTAPGLDDGPEYTPDGKYIYFNSVRSGGMQIWRMKSDGSDQEQLTNDEYNNWFPHISPDGKSMVFVTYLVGEVQPSDHPAAKRVYLRLMPLDGGTPKVVAYLYGGQGTMNVPSWSPDGKKLAFVSNTVPM